MLNEIEQSAFAEQLVVIIAAFGVRIRVEQEPIAWFDLEDEVFVSGRFIQSEGKVVTEGPYRLWADSGTPSNLGHVCKSAARMSSVG